MCIIPDLWHCINTLRPKQNGRQFPDDIFKRISLNETVWILISLKFVPRVPINNIPTLVQMMAWRRPGDKPLSEPIMVSLLTHICVARPQWVKIACDTIKRRYVQVKYNKETVIVMTNNTHTCFISRLYSIIFQYNVNGSSNTYTCWCHVYGKVFRFTGLF